MSTFADLEISLRRQDRTNYIVDLRFVHPLSDADVRLVQSDDVPIVRFDQAQLREHTLDPMAYGTILTNALFADNAVVVAFEEARKMAQLIEQPLRVRLFIDHSALDLHTLRWETLRLPRMPEYGISTHEQIYFSRYLSSNDWHPVRLRPRSDLRALVVVANPANLSEYAPDNTPLPAVDVAGEVERAKAGLEPTIPTTVLASGGQATLDEIAKELRDGNGYDILYLVAHGALIRDEPYLWLETEDGDADVVNGNELVKQIGKLRQRPRLVVLASCQSAGSGDERVQQSHDNGILAALGPRLCEMGIPAVLAMQANITMETVKIFIPRFFAELQRDGQIDRAMAVARDRVRERHDWWVPVLFMRLKGGCIWYNPGFSSSSFDLWPLLVQNIKANTCTPILGTHLSELLGTQTEIAQYWAEQHNFPFEWYRCEHLSQVAQYLAGKFEREFPRKDLLDQLKEELLIRYEETMPEQTDLETLELPALLNLVGRMRREQNEADPYRVLANLPFTIYITTNFTDMLHDALIEAGKDPQVVIFPWSDALKRLPIIYNNEPDYQPTVERPLIYHLFGHLSIPESLVVTEDDYFDYLIGFAANNDMIPPAVTESLNERGLLFMGFQPDDWDFRIVFRSLPTLWLGFQHFRRNKINISAQIAPTEDRIQDPVRARRYLEKYLKEEANIEIYWGSVDDFAQALQQAWQQEAKPEESARGRRGRRR